MPTTRRKTPRFRNGQKVRVIKKCRYYPDHPDIPHDFALNRWVIVKETLSGGTAFGVTIPGYPNTIDYQVRELRSRSTR
jgi:hypothetical protein